MTDSQPGDLVPLKDPDPVKLFRPQGLDPILAEIEKQARSIVPDTSTAKGRAAVISIAAKVTRAKTYLDGLGKDHVSEIKAQAKEIDAERRAMRDRLDTLAAEVRAPVTEWEEAAKREEGAKREQIAAVRETVRAAKARAAETNDPAELAAILADLEAIEIEEETAGETEPFRDAAIYRIDLQRRALIEAREREEAARQEAEERAREEQEAREKAIAEQARQEAEERAKAAEAEAAAAEKARIEAEKAREKARIEAEERAKVAKANAEKQQREAAERAARKERERIAAEAAAEVEAAAKREKDRKHRGAINRQAVGDLIEFADISPEAAKAAIKAIASGQVANVSIRY